MITRITGNLVRLSNEAATIAAGPFEYEVFIPEFVRRQLQGRIGEEIHLRTIEYLEGNPARGNLVPRMIGFASDAEREFFDAICSVDGVGVRKALRAMVRPVREVAVAIEEQDVKQLSALPGIGAALAERIIAKLRRRMAKFALMIEREGPPEKEPERGVLADAHDALVSLGHSASEARQMVERAAQSGRKFKGVEEVLEEIYQSKHKGS